MQKTRIDDVRCGRDNPQGDEDLILLAVSIQIRSLPVYNGSGPVPSNQYRNKNRNRQVVSAQVEAVMLRCIETISNELR
jgi:hypothetical protein